MADSTRYSDDSYFAPVLPWQHLLWTQITQRVQDPERPLPHALLAAGMPGMGKRAFVWRLVAWLLCHERETHPEGACATCESCQWLRSGTHPSLQVLPQTCLPRSAAYAEPAAKQKRSKSVSPASTPNLKIKIDDIRNLQPFIHQGGQGMRLCVLDHAEQMTIAAANALLKTLEEPQAQVHLLLISDMPSQLLPTIKSRVQQLPLQKIAPSQARDYIRAKLALAADEQAAGEAIDTISDSVVAQLMQLANGAPLAAVTLAQSPWYDQRSLWLTTWLALRSGKRSAIAASDYWQSILSVTEFIDLSEMMLMDIQRLSLGLAPLQQDVDLPAAMANYVPSESACVRLAHCLQEGKVVLKQNVQDKFVYDKLMQELAQF